MSNENVVTESRKTEQEIFNEKMAGTIQVSAFIIALMVSSFFAIDYAFLKSKSAGAILEGKYSTMPRSEMVSVSSRNSYAEKVAEFGEEYFFSIRLKDQLSLIQVDKETYEKSKVGTSVPITYKETRLTNALSIDNIGVKPLSNQARARIQEDIRNTYAENVKQKSN